MKDQVMLEVKNLDVAYHDFEAVHDISLSIKQGSVVSIIGANGAGKSTIMKTIVGINKPKKGSVQFMGQDITGTRTSKIVSMGLTMSPEGSHTFEKDDHPRQLIDGRISGQEQQGAHGAAGEDLSPVSRSSKKSRTSSPLFFPAGNARCWRSAGRSWPSRRCCCSMRSL